MCRYMYVCMYLEMQPLLSEIVIIRAPLETDFTIRVIFIDEVLDDGAGLRDRKVVVVRVDQAGHAAVGVYRDVAGGLGLAVGNFDDLVWEVESFEDEDDLEGVDHAD